MLQIFALKLWIQAGRLDNCKRKHYNQHNKKIITLLYNPDCAQHKLLYKLIEQSSMHNAQDGLAGWLSWTEAIMYIGR